MGNLTHVSDDNDAPRPAAPSPAALARLAPTRPSTVPAPEPPAAVSDHSASAAFGRVDEQGRVFVREDEGEREVGSYPDATPEEALQYFARKYDELYASAALLHQRLDSPEVSAKEIADGLKSLRAHSEQPNVVGDLPALAKLVGEIDEGLATKRQEEQAHRAEAKKQATLEREAIVEEAEKIAAQPVEKVQWKQSTTRMRELLQEWKAHQRGKVRLDKDVENALWKRFSRSRNGFDKTRRAHFARLEQVRGEVKQVKLGLVEEAERLSTSTDWNATAGAFKRLMSQWRAAGRAGRSDDDKLWQRFRTAQDHFFNAKDEQAAIEDESYRGNLEVKEGLLEEAKALLPVKDLERTKAALRDIQERWEAAGKVPRADIDRMEKGMRRVEQTVRDAEEKKWSATDPEKSDRAASMVTQLQSRIAELEEEAAAAEAKGDQSSASKLREQQQSHQMLLDQARKGLDEFGG